MSRRRIERRRLRRPWSGVQAAIWLIGLAILFLTERWWPGILILVAVSVLAQAVIQAAVPGAMEEIEPEERSGMPVPGEMEDVKPAGHEEPAESQTPASVRHIEAAAEVQHPTGRLPSECPRCGGPVRGHEVRWTGPESADCPYCGANLPLAAIK